ncbi:major facilitator superfamily transporter [Xylaria telfairii]|nr:major facilitator superfamily transporter [Xylaria telfairii]
MAFQEAMWSNSVWSRDTYNIALRHPEQRNRPSNHVSGNGRLPAPREPVSTWSTDTDDDDDENSTLFVTTICLAHLCAQAGIGQTLPIMKGVESRFRVANANNLSSSVSGYAMALGAFILIAGRLGKIFGHKPVFMMGLVWSAIWSLIVGASFYSNQSLFIASRAFQGLGSALTLPTGLALLKALHPTDTRETVIMSLYAAMSPTGLILGALGAGILDKLAWWSWVYWAFSITLVALRTISRFIIPPTIPAKRRPSGLRAATSVFDAPGMITSITFLGLFGFAWGQAHVGGWQQGYIWIILIISVVLAAAFVMIETWYAQEPLVPSSTLSWEVFWILVAIGSGWSCFGIWLFYGWQFVERLRSASPLMTTAYFTPILAVGCFAAVTTRLILRRFGPHGVLCVALLAILLASVLIATMPVRQSYWQQLFISAVFMAWGLYTSIPAATSMISRAARKRLGGIAASLVWVATYYGMGLGLAVAGTAEHSAMSGKLTIHNRLRGHRAVYWTSVALAGLGLAVCLALTFASGSTYLPTADSEREGIATTKGSAIVNM